MSIGGTDRKVIDLFVKISNAGKSTRSKAFLILLCLLILSIIGAFLFSTTLLFIPLVSFFLARPYINTLHDRNITTYLSKNKDVLDVRLTDKIHALTKEQKLHYCKEALMIEIRSKLQAKNMLPTDKNSS